ncbi:MAG: hypothetical protein JO196_16900, partial [Hyphomicrobiales bacterium]|nr:hypothetical protein [Hyphomicrobiales bacterium]
MQSFSVRIEAMDMRGIGQKMCSISGRKADLADAARREIADAGDVDMKEGVAA